MMDITVIDDGSFFENKMRVRIDLNMANGPIPRNISEVHVVEGGDALVFTLVETREPKDLGIYSNKDWPNLFADQDDCLIHICDGKRPPNRFLRRLPPWRAYLIAQVARRAGVMTEDDVQEIGDEAMVTGGSGRLEMKP